MAKNDYAHLADLAKDAQGYDGLNSDTMAIPFIRICQALSPQLKKTKAEYIPEAEEGDIINSVTGAIYPKPLRIVVGKFERLFIEWKANRGGFVQAHLPEAIEMNQKYVMNDKYQLVDEETGNVFVDTYMYYIILPDYVNEGVCLISMSSTQLKEGKKLNRNLMTTVIPGTSQKAMPHYMVWNMDATAMSNDKGDWFNPTFTLDSFVTPDLLDNVVTERKLLPNKTVDFAQLEDKGSKDNGKY